jgi:uncharacterized iron-regulated protein
MKAMNTLLLAAALPLGCTAAPDLAQRVMLDNPDELRITACSDGTDLTWHALVDRAAACDVIVLGELHNDAVGHAVQLALVEAVLDRVPNGAVALEMLERDEQILVADYADDILSAEAFAKATHSQQWAGPGSWDAWYQPVIDAALDRGGHVVAANAPRRYVRLSRTDGFEAVKALDDTRAALVHIPDPPLSGHYRKRFMDLMHESGAEHVDPDVADDFFRSQQTWDATMAYSVVEALRAGHGPVLLLVGQFHSDHEGGTVQCIRRLAPYATVLVVSLVDALNEAHTAGDGPRADVIVHTRD